MLKTQLLHPTILNALGMSGHGSKVLIADGNYPFITGANPEAEYVFLNLCPGIASVTDILSSILTSVPVEAVHVMQTADGSEPPIYSDFRRLIPDLQLQPVERFAFYDMCRGRDVSLVVASGDQRLYANIVLTIGVVPPA
ncbi:MAG: RbsD or FucU transport [Chloroflexi bacterium]|nr:RbsD or FucU transport [Chloroflexota bacterium]MDL1884092.1 RbsD or FucU transport [Anaerolineae bacterium CFX8]GIL12411.1 MAG: transporter [Chloroflexota bacterium]